LKFGRELRTAERTDLQSQVERLTEHIIYLQAELERILTQYEKEMTERKRGQ
jgi:hypothetical protein